MGLARELRFSVPLLIDTYNVLHTVGVLPPEFAGVDVQGLVALIQRSRYRSERLTLVCDGLPPADAPPVAHDPKLKIHFSGPGRPADDLIAQMIRASTAPRRLLVISSDHAILRDARRRRCRTMTSEQFLDQLAKDAGAAAPLRHRTGKPAAGPASQEQVERWLRVFDVAEEDVAALEPAEEIVEEPVEPAPPAPVAREDADADEYRSHRDTETIPRVLPSDLIAEAERMWEREAPPRAPAESAPTPPAQVEAAPAPDSVDGDAALHAQRDAVDDKAEAPDQLDMNAWLPQDGRTRQWKRGE